MKRRWFFYIAFGLSFYFLFLLVNAPASWFAWGLVRASHGMLSLAEPQGSLWEGQGELVIHQAPTPPQGVVPLQWRIHPLWLLAGQLQLSLKGVGVERELQTDLRLAYRQVHLRDLTLSFPASHARIFYAPAAFLGPQGKLRLLAPSIDINSTGLHGTVELVWEDAGSSFSGAQPLGNYQLAMEGKGDTVDIKLATLGGDLNVTGQGQWQLSKGILVFTGTAQPLGRINELEKLLAFLGPDTGAGKRRLSINTPMPIVLPASQQ